MAQFQAHLPEEPNRFIGREREIAELRGMLRQARALTLCGPGGIGKTRLALRILTAAAAEYPDGTWFVELADLRQPDLVVSRVAAVLGVSEEAGRPLLDTLADALRPRRMVLALLPWRIFQRMQQSLSARIGLERLGFGLMSGRKRIRLRNILMCC